MSLLTEFNGEVATLIDWKHPQAFKRSHMAFALVVYNRILRANAALPRSVTNIQTGAVLPAFVTPPDPAILAEMFVSGDVGFAAQLKAVQTWLNGVGLSTVQVASLARYDYDNDVYPNPTGKPDAVLFTPIFDVGPILSGPLEMAPDRVAIFAFIEGLIETMVKSLVAVPNPVWVETTPVPWVF